MSLEHSPFHATGFNFGRIDQLVEHKIPPDLRHPSPACPSLQAPAFISPPKILFDSKVFLRCILVKLIIVGFSDIYTLFWSSKSDTVTNLDSSRYMKHKSERLKFSIEETCKYSELYSPYVVQPFITNFITAEKMKFSRFLWIWSHLLKKSLIENFIF